MVLLKRIEFVWPFYLHPPMHRLFSSVLLVMIFTPRARAAEPPPALDVTDRWEMQYDTAALWSIGRDATPLSYTFLPQILSVKSPQFTRFEVGGGELVVRARLSLLAEPIVRGPEDRYFGFSLSPSVEWWNKSRSFAAFASVGGGLGVMDSEGYKVDGAQGQDLNLNWFVHLGLKYRWNDHLSASAGLMFQHISNGGQDRVNPGVNSLGPTLGLSWHF